MKIDFIVPNYNSSHLLEKNLDTMLAALGDRGRIIIVDDGSKDESKELIKQLAGKYPDSKVLLVMHQKNKGYGSAVNTGVSHSDAELVGLLNTDVSPRKNFLEFVLPHFEKETMFAVGCMDESIEGESTVLRGRGAGRFEKGMLLHSKLDENGTYTFWVSGGSGIYRRDLFNKFKGMDTIYNPFYWEDIDLSYRAQRAGYEVLFEKRAIVEHRHAEGSIKKNFASSRVTTISYRNQFIFIWKNITDWDLLLFHYLYLPYNLYGAVRRKDTAFFKGFFLALGRIPAILSKRRLQKKLNVFSDREVIKDIK